MDDGRADLEIYELMIDSKAGCDDAVVSLFAFQTSMHVCIQSVLKIICFFRWHLLISGNHHSLLETTKHYSHGFNLQWEQIWRKL